jgi:hypothetical protein
MNGQSGERGLAKGVLEHLEQSGSNKYPASIQYFYPGIHYRFLTNEYPHLGWFKNGDCTGKELVCDHREEPDNGEGNFRVLRYLPKYILVQPFEINNGDLCGTTFPPNTIPLEADKFTETVNLPCTMKVFDDSSSMSKEFVLHRKCHPVESVVTFTDYYSQGLSFKGQPTFLHLGIDKGRYSRGNFLVPLSRPACIEDVVLLQPLWGPEDRAGQEAFLRKFKTAIQPNQENENEMIRYAAVMNDTVAKHLTRLAETFGFEYQQPNSAQPPVAQTTLGKRQDGTSSKRDNHPRRQDGGMRKALAEQDRGKDRGGPSTSIPHTGRRQTTETSRPSTTKGERAMPSTPSTLTAPREAQIQKMPSSPYPNVPFSTETIIGVYGREVFYTSPNGDCAVLACLQYLGYRSLYLDGHRNGMSGILR